MSTLLSLACLLPASLFAETAETLRPPLIEQGTPSREHILAFRDMHEGKVQRRIPLRDQRTLEHYDVVYYELWLDMPTGEDGLQGVVEMHFRSLENGLQQILLHAGDNLSLQSMEVDGASVAGVLQNGEDVTVALPEALSAGESAVLRMEYTAGYTGGGVLPTSNFNIQTGQNIDVLTTQAEPWDARRFWPCRDLPIDKADSLRAHISSQDFNTIVSNGVLEADVDNGDGTRTATWFESWPMVTYLFSVCIAPYNYLEDTWNWEGTDLPVVEYSWGLSPSEQDWVTQTGIDALQAFSERIQPYPFLDEKYGHAQYTWGGAMEHQTISSMGFYNQAVIAHELMHQWFGDKVTCKTFHHIWLNEGWATYGESLFQEYLNGPAGLHANMDLEEYYGPGTIYVEDPETQTIFDGNLSYAKGSWVLHMLRHVMGDSTFFAATNDYLGDGSRDNHRSVDTEEFVGYMESAYGGDLDWFFQQWIFGEYYPEYGYSWSTSNEGGELLRIDIVQLQVPERQTFTMPMDIRITLDGGGEMQVQAWIDEAAEHLEYFVPQAVSEVELDPENWILRQLTPLSNLPAAPRLHEAWLTNEEGAEIQQVPDSGVYNLNLRVVNTGGSVDDVLMYLSSLHPDVIPASMGYNTGPLAGGGSFEFAVPCQTFAELSGPVDFELELSWGEDGEATEHFSFASTRADLLIVDDDGGDAYEEYLLLAAEGQAQVQVVTPAEVPALDLDHTRLLAWMQGDNGEEIAGAAREALESYVESGGHLVLSGQNLAGAQDPAWLLSFCGLEVLETEVGGQAINGDTGAFFHDELLFFMNGGAGNQASMERFSPQGSVPVFRHFGSGDPGDAGVVQPQGSGEVLSLGWGLEGLSGAGNTMGLDQVLDRLLAWADGEVELGGEAVTRPRSLRIASVFPNPFNPSTRIRVELEREQPLEVMVFNLAGQLVDTIHKGRLAAGEHEFSWQPQGISSGVYLLMVNGARARETQKMLFLK